MANARGTQLVRTPVGDAHVLRAMKEHSADLGGEPSGHIIIAPYLPAADGISPHFLPHIRLD